MINIKDIKETEFSTDNEHFDYQDDLREFIFDNELSVGGVFYAGVQEPVKPSQFFSIDSLMEQMQANADESEFSEWTEDYLTDLDKKILKTLDKKISALLDEYLPKPIFQYVIDTVKYRIVTIDDDKNVYVEEVK